MKTKQCIICNEIKIKSDFYKYSNNKYLPYCKACKGILYLYWSRTKKGLISKIYGAQRYASKKRGHSMPQYTLKQLAKWIFKQPNFNTLYNNWVKSEYKRILIPSCDRLDDYKPYTLDNLRLVTWDENETKGHDDRKNGINNKASKAVKQYDSNYNFIKEYFSISEAARKTGVQLSGICRCCRNEINTSGSFIWEYKDKIL